MKKRLILALRSRSLLAGCGEKAEPTRRRARRGRTRSRSCSTTSPTPTTRGSTPRRRPGSTPQAGLDVKLQAPPDPSAPLKLLRAGRADLAISYEPELLLARDAGAENLVAVGALVQTPLTSLIALPSAGVQSPADLAGKRVAHRRHPLPERLPEDDPREGGRGPGLGQGDQRRLQPRPGDAVQEGRRDARRVLELRGRRPPAPRPQARDPAHGEARRADLQRADPRRAARVAGRRRRLAAAALHHRDGGRPPARARPTRRPASTRC